MNTEVAAPAEAVPVVYEHLAERAAALELVEAGMVLVEKANKYPITLSDTDAAIVSELRARLNQTITNTDNERLDMTAEARRRQKSVNDEFAEKLTPMKAALVKIDAAITAHVKRKQKEADDAATARREEQAKLVREEEARQAAARKTAADAETARLAANKAAADAAEAVRKAEASGSQRSAKAAQKAAAEAEATRKAADEAAANSQRQEEEAQRQSEATAQRQQELASMPVVSAASVKRVVGTYGSYTTLRDNWTYEVVDIAKVPDAFLVPAEERIQKSVLNALAKSQKDKANVPGIRFWNDAKPRSQAGA